MQNGCQLNVETFFMFVGDAICGEQMHHEPVANNLPSQERKTHPTSQQSS